MSAIFHNLWSDINNRIGSTHADRSLVRTIDFGAQPEGDPRSWLLERGYIMELDSEDIELTFKNKSEIPPITGITFQMNTKNTTGEAHAFIRKLSFYSDK